MFGSNQLNKAQSLKDKYKQKQYDKLNQCADVLVIDLLKQQFAKKAPKPIHLAKKQKYTHYEYSDSD